MNLISAFYQTNTKQNFTLGESLLHVLIICDSPIHTRIARLLLKNFPKSALDKVEGEEYLGTQKKSSKMPHSF